MYCMYSQDKLMGYFGAYFSISYIILYIFVLFLFILFKHLSHCKFQNLKMCFDIFFPTNTFLFTFYK